MGRMARRKDGMKQRRYILSIVAITCFIATTTLHFGLGRAQTSLDPAMANLITTTQKLGAPKVEGRDLYFGTTKADNSLVDAVAKAHGGAATLFVKSGGEYLRCATTLKKEDGSNAIGTTLDATSPALARLNAGEGYYERNVTVFGKPYVVGYEPIKDASGAIIGAYSVARQQ
jgi:Cache 3/Cache 2 fusion domain